MTNSSVSDIERTLRQRIDICVSLDDLRIIINCFRAIEYWSETDGESYLDKDGRALKKRLEALYLDELGEGRRWSFDSKLLTFAAPDL
jgi:hypothetical protein